MYTTLHAVKRFSLALVLLSTAQFARAGQLWVLKKDKDGIRVYTARNENSAFHSVKAECTVDATIPQIVALLCDVDHHKDWVYGIRSARLLQKPDPSAFIYYSEVNVPWPCSNRDFIATTKMYQPSPGILYIDSHVEPDLLPEEAGIVRVRRSTAHWSLTAQGSKVMVEYIVDFDPGGNVPAWAVNLFVTDGPYKTFANLKQEAAKSTYKDAHFDFIR